MPTKPENGWKLTAPKLEQICSEDSNRPRIVILNYPNNPTGTTYKKDELKEIAKVAREHRVIFLSDEIYGELHHLGQHVSMARFYPEGTIISGGLSKWAGAGGWRLGTFTFPRNLQWLLDAMSVVASETYTSTSAPIQYAAVRAFRGSIDIECYLKQSRRILRALGHYAAETLIKSGLLVPKPQGAFYLFPNFKPFRKVLQSRGITSSRKLCESLLKDCGIACLPGSVFGRPRNELTVRMAYVDFDGARALAAVEQLPNDVAISKDFLQTYCGNIMDALDIPVEWIERL